MSKFFVFFRHYDKAKIGPLRIFSILLLLVAAGCASKDDLHKIDTELKAIKGTAEEALNLAEEAQIQAENAVIEAEDARSEAEDVQIQVESAQAEAENAAIEAEEALEQAENSC